MDVLPNENEFLDKKEELYGYIIKLYSNLFGKENLYIYDSIIKVFSDVQKKSFNSLLLNIKDEFTDFSNDSIMIINKKINNSNIANPDSIILGKNYDINSYK